MSNKVRAKGAGRPAAAPRSPFAKSRRTPAAADAEVIGFGIQRWLVIVAVAGTQLLVLTNSADPVNVPKFTLLLLVTIALIGLTAVRVASARKLVVPTGLTGYAIAAFGVAAVIATAIAPATGIALWGGYLRNAGLFLYLAGIVLFATVVRVADDAFYRRLVFALVAVGGLLSLYSLLQHFNIDPIPWYKFAYSNPVSTFGNPDFAGAFYAISLPLAFWAALWSGLQTYWRLACGVAAALLVVGIVLSGAAQGYVGAAAGLFVLLLGWILTRPPQVRRPAVVAWAGAAAIGLGLLLAGLASAGPLSRLGGSGAVSIRRHFWAAATSMFTHHPVAGVGMNMYGEYFRGYRSAAVVNALGYKDAPDAPHSVPVAMFADGGLLLGLSYLAFVVAVAVALVRACRRADSAGVMLTAALGAAWIAFQVDSAVSVDVVPLVTLHFVLAGAIVARSSPRMRPFRFGGEQGRRPQRATAVSPVAVGVAGIAALVLMWFAIQPLRADIHSNDAAKATARGDAQSALADLQDATSEASWQGVYWLQRSTADGAVGNVQQGLADLRHALDVDPRDVDAASSLARVDAALKDYTAAAKYFRIAIRLDPRNPELQVGLKDALTHQ